MSNSNKQDLKFKFKLKSKKYLIGFTLVELIVVIVILAILATIAFLSFNSYSASSRNSSRATDISNITSSLELYNVKTGNYPIPDNSITISYLGGSVWSQGTISDGVIRKLGNVSKKIVDPLTSSEYVYSALTYAKSSYQIKSDYEGDSIGYLDGNIGVEKVSADSNERLAYIKGNYMNTVAKTVTGGLVYVVATPSIITTVTTSSEISNDSLSGTLLYNGQSSSSGIAYNPNRLVYTGITLPVDDSSGGLTKIMNGTISAYSGTIVASINSNVKELLNTPTTNVPTTGGYVVKNQLGGGSSVGGNNGGNNEGTNTVDYSICTATGQTYTGTTTYSDTYGTCDTPDKIVCSGIGAGQTWSMCNIGSSIAGLTSASYGNYYQWGRNDDVTSTTATSSLAPNTALANTVGHSEFITAPNSPFDWINFPQKNNLWGGETTTSTTGYYSEQTTINKSLMQGPCSSGYHVPTKKEWHVLIFSFNPTITIANYWQSDPNVRNALNFPLSGHRLPENGNIYVRGTNGHYWTSSPNFDGYYFGYAMAFSNGAIYNNSYNSRACGFNIRCIKNN